MKMRRRRASVLPRPDWRAAHAPGSALNRQVWSRGERPVREPGEAGSRALRSLAAVMALAELALLGYLAAGPAFKVHDIRVTGARHLQPAAVVDAAGLRRPGSVFTVDADGIQRKLTDLPWVRTAKVEVQMPDRVVLRIDEWQPVAVYRAGPRGRLIYLSDQGVALGPGVVDEGLAEIDGPPLPDPRVGRRPLDLQLLTALVNIQREFPALTGQVVQSFTLDGCGNLTLTAKKGWKVYFGRVLTPEEFATLHDKLAALKSVSSEVNFGSTDLEYVNVMNPTEPAVKMRSTKPAPQPSPGPSPSPAPSPTGIQVLSCR